MIRKTKTGNPISYFHGTNEHFDEFEDTSDIGFHFGTKKSAMERMKTHGAPEFEIETIEPDLEDINALSVIQSKENQLNPFKRLQRAKLQGFNTSKVVYHGSSRSGYVESTDITSFNKDKIGDKWSADEKGFFFTSFQNFGNDYALSDRDYSIPGSGNGAVYPVYLRMRNPLVINESFLAKENMTRIGEIEDSISFWDVYQSLILEWCQDGRHDGVILQDSVHKDQNGNPIETHVVFEPEQIRSIFSNFEAEFANIKEIHEQANPSFERINSLKLAYETIYPTLQNPKDDLKGILSKLSQNELLELINEHKSKPISESFTERVARAKSGKYVSLKLNGSEVARTSTKKEAISKRSEIRKGLLKEVNLIANNSIRLPDLGTWKPYSIAIESGLSTSSINNIMSQNSEQEQYEKLKDELKAMGYDSIVYKNEVESKGSESIIVFDKSQIVPIIEKDMDVEFSL